MSQAAIPAGLKYVVLIVKENRTFDEVFGDIERGEGIAASLAKHSVFPSMIIRMISAGEQTGKIDNMLERISAWKFLYPPAAYTKTVSIDGKGERHIETFARKKDADARHAVALRPPPASGTLMR